MNIEDMKHIPARSGIYKIYNIITNEFYVGSAVNLRYRFSRHIRQLQQQKHFNPILQNSWNKHGKENFNFEIIEIIENMRKKLIDEKKSYGENNPSSKVNWEIVNKIRYDREVYFLSSCKLSKKYDLSKSQILRIINYQSWKKIDAA